MYINYIKKIFKTIEIVIILKLIEGRNKGIEEETYILNN